jgi:hypothetical protein
VYADVQEAEAARGAASPAFLGTVPVVLNDKDNRHPDPARAARGVPGHEAAQAAARAPGRRSSFRWSSAVPRGEKGRVLPLRARAVRFSVAQVE